jgi:hypothetical protein
MVLGIIFLSISMLLLSINKTVALGSIYTAIYTSDSLLLSEENIGTTDMSEAVKDSIESDCMQSMKLTDEVDVQVDIDKCESGVALIPDSGSILASVNYEMDCPGIFTLIKDSIINDELSGCEEIRDTSNNLRRWQIYGEVLSD